MKYKNTNCMIYTQELFEGPCITEQTLIVMALVCFYMH